MKPPVLPPAPVDGYEIRWWSIESYARGLVIEGHMARYHIHCQWKDEPDTGRTGNGVAFVHQWMMFHNGRFTGRTDGWDWPTRKATGWENVYATRLEAASALVEHIKVRIKDCEVELGGLRVRLAEAIKEAGTDGS